MRIRLIAVGDTGRTGIYGADGELEVGTELDFDDEPVQWKGRYEIVSSKPAKDAEVITNPRGRPRKDAE